MLTLRFPRKIWGVPLIILPANLRGSNCQISQFSAAQCCAHLCWSCFCAQLLWTNLSCQLQDKHLQFSHIIYECCVLQYWTLHCLAVFLLFWKILHKSVTSDVWHRKWYNPKHNTNRKSQLGTEIPLTFQASISTHWLSRKRGKYFSLLLDETGRKKRLGVSHMHFLPPPLVCIIKKRLLRAAVILALVCRFTVSCEVYIASLRQD